MENQPNQNNRNDDNPRMVYVSRAPSPEAPEISEEVKRRHNDSAAKYPELNLSSAEYMVADVRRHVIGAVPPIFGAAVFVIVVAIFIAAYEPLIDQAGLTNNAPSVWWVALGGGILSLLVVLFAYIATWVFKMNRFYLTNESVIQRIQNGLFSHREQTINLSNIEDASYTQRGIMQSMFGYGSIRLSTEGDETTYRMTFVASPKEQVAKLTNAVEAFKNGRPIVD